MNRAKVLMSDKFDKSRLREFRKKGQSMILAFVQVIAIDDDFSMDEISWTEHETSVDTVFILELRLGEKTPVTLITMTTYDLVQYSQQVDADKFRGRIKSRLSEAKFYISILSTRTRNKL